MATATASVLGNRGGNHASGDLPGSSGGGGATNVGNGATQYCGARGGQGYTSNILHLTDQVYGSGGGGGSRGNCCCATAVGGTGAGSAGYGNGGSGTANRGGGGGGGGTPCSGTRAGGSGGSGIVVVAYDTTNPMSITATGGSVATHGNWRSHQFTAVGADTFAVLTAGYCDVLIVGGGGGGAGGSGCSAGGGGGGGQVIHIRNYGLSVSTYSTTVGAGGSQNLPGSSSLFNDITATGGGQGNGGNGGSGGGGPRGGLGGLAITPPTNLIPGIVLSYTSISVGWTGIPQCLACEAGKFKNTVGTLGCTDCPPNSQSLSGSNDCVCVAGYTGPDGGACTACAAGKYKANPGSSECTACLPDSYHALTGRTAASGCQCNAGTRVGVACACPLCLPALLCFVLPCPAAISICLFQTPRACAVTRAAPRGWMLWSSCWSSCWASRTRQDRSVQITRSRPAGPPSGPAAPAAQATPTPPASSTSRARAAAAGVRLRQFLQLVGKMLRCGNSQMEILLVIIMFSLLVKTTIG